MSRDFETSHEDINAISKYGDEVVNIFKRVGILHAEFHSISENIIRASTEEDKRSLALELASKSKVLIDTILLLVNKISSQYQNVNER